MHCIPYHALQNGHFRKGDHLHRKGQHHHHHHLHYHHGVSLYSDKSSRKYCLWNKHVYGPCYSEHQFNVNTHIFPGTSRSEMGFYSIPNCRSPVHDSKKDVSYHWTKKQGRGTWGKRAGDTLKKKTELGKTSQECQCHLGRESENNNHGQQTGNRHRESDSSETQTKFDSKHVCGCYKTHSFSFSDHRECNWLRINKKHNCHCSTLLMACRLRHSPEERQTVGHNHGQKHVYWCQSLTEINDSTTHCCNETRECTGPHPTCESKDSNDRQEENRKQSETTDEGADHGACGDESSVHEPNGNEGTSVEESPTTCSEGNVHCSKDKSERKSLNDQQNSNNENEDGVPCDKPGSSKVSRTDKEMD